MTLGLAFWILMLIWFVFGILTHYGMIAGAYGPLGNTLLLFVLFLLLGWTVFGPDTRIKRRARPLTRTAPPPSRLVGG